MSARITITTKGTQGAGKIPQEFTANINKVAATKPLDEYAANVADQIQQDAPVLTGYLRNNIRSWRENINTVHVTSWAPYSGPAEVRSSRPYFFRNNALPSANIGAHLIGDASFQYFKTLVNKYQNQP